MSQPAPAASALVLAAGFGALVLWGGTAVANKAAVAHMDAMTAGILRSLLAGSIAAALALGLRMPFPRASRERVLLLVSGITSFAIWPALLSLGLGATTASHAALIMAMLPVTTGLIAAAFEGRWPRLGWWGGVALAVLGVFFLIFFRSGGAILSADANITGDLIVLAGIAICSLGYVAGGRVSRTIGAPATLFWGLAVAVLALLPAFLLLAGRTEWAAVGGAGWAAIAYMTLLSSLVGYGLWFWALGRGGIARVGSWQFTQPILTLAFAALLLGEALTPALGAAAALILAGTWFAQRRAEAR